MTGRADGGRRLARQADARRAARGAAGARLDSHADRAADGGRSAGPRGVRVQAPVAPTYFARPAAFRRWLERHHASSRELIVGFHRRASGTPSITYPDALDEALCFGWIDGVRRSVDADRYTIRFTPRKPDSYWSRVNTRKAEALLAEGRMHASGRAVFDSRDAARTAKYSFEREEAALTPAQRRAFKANAEAWRFFQGQAPWYQRVTAFWVTSAKREETRQRRLTQLIACSAAGRRLPQLARPAPRGR